MECATPESSETELARRRSNIRRSLLRVSTAGLIVVIVVVGLAVAAVLTAVREQRSVVRAEAATARAQEELRKSHLAQARVGRVSALMGRKAEGLAAVAAAAKIQPTLEARNEAIAHFALLDLEDTGLRWPEPVTGQVVFDPALEQFALTTNGTTLLIGRVSNLAAVCQYDEPGMRIERLLKFAPNGRFVALVCQGQRLLLFDVENRQPAFWAEVPETLRGVAFTPTSELMAFVHADKSVRVVRTGSGEAVVRLQPGGQPYLLQFDSEGKRLAVTSGRRVLTYALEDGKAGAPLELVRPVYSLAWNGAVMVLGDGFGEILIHQEKRSTRRFVAHKDRVSDLFLTPDGHQVYSVSYDGSTRLWDVESGRMLLSTTIGYARQTSTDGRRVAYANSAGWGLWQVQPPIGYRTLHTADGLNPFIHHLDFSPDGRLLTVAKTGALRIVDAETGEVLLAHQEAGLAPWAHFLADGRTLVTARKDALWLPSLIVSSNGNSPEIALGSGSQIAVSGIDGGVGTMSLDRRQVVMPLGRTSLALIDLENPEKTVRFSGVARPLRPALAADKSWMASGSLHGSGTILWDTATGKQLRELYSGNAYCFASPDGRFLAVGGSDAYRMFDTRSWEIVQTIPSERGSELPNFAAFSSDGSLLAIVKEHSRVQLWDPRRWRRLADFISPDPQIIHWLAFSPDARRLAVATTRDRVELWDLSVLRTQLEKLALDWPDSGGDQEGSLIALAAAGVSGASGATTVVVTVLAGVGLVVFCAGFVLRRQRELISAYLQVDSQMEQRTRELELAQAEILHGQKMKALGTLAAGIAHDFNNLLSIIRMANKLSGQESPANPEVQENVRLVEKAVGQGKQLVNSMLGYSRESAEEQGPFQVAEVVENAVGLLSKQFLSGIELKLNLERQLPLVAVSRSRLEQILLNLIVNASEAMKGGGVLRIGVTAGSAPNGNWTLPPTKAGRYVQFSVADNGAGIPPGILPRIFEPFFTTKHVGATRGTGLGLSMVYTLAQHEGMGVRVESEPGRGTTFFIIIPAGEAL